MGVPENALLQQKVELLRQSTEYRLLLETAAICSQSGGLPEDPLATVADIVLRPIARDLSSSTKSSKIMLHMYISGV